MKQTKQKDKKTEKKVLGLNKKEEDEMVEKWCAHEY